MINKIDFLSPPITLFHFEKRTHTSKLGAYLVIILMTICFSYTIFLLINLTTHKKMTYIFHKKFEFEAGYYSFNSSSVFHFIQIYSSDDGGYFDKFDLKYIRAFTTYAHSNLSYDNLYLYDHWVFDMCRKNIEDKNLDSSLFQNVENFTNAVCIRHYYNSLEKKYYSYGNKGFKWPHLEHGIAQRKNIYLTTLVQKCSNNSVINELFGNCASEKEIDDYLKKYLGIYLYFTDTQIDITDFKNPITKYLQVMSTGIGTSQTYVESYIHFSPVRVKTVIGELFGETHDINSFYFDFNRKGSANNAGEKYFTITKYYHLMQNNVQIYERRYNNIFDLFSEIGGIAQFIFYLFYWINYIYNQFVIDFDTNTLFFSIKDNRPLSNNNNFNINSLSNKIKINGNDNKIYNIQNNILKISKKGTKKVRNSKFFIEKNENNNNKFQDYDANILTNQINREENYSFDKKNNKKNKTFIRRENTISANKIINDNTHDILYNLKISNEIVDHIDSYRFNKKPYRMTNTHEFNIKPTNNKLIQKDNYNLENHNKYILNRDEINIKKKHKSSNYIITNIPISKISISQMLNLKEKNTKKNKYFSLFYFMKSLILKKDKYNYLYLSLFRKHLLSEEHLLKSHVNMVLFEKKYNLNNEEITNIFECYNKL